MLLSRKYRASLLCLVLASLGGCAFGGGYTTPEFDVSDKWSSVGQPELGKLSQPDGRSSDADLHNEKGNVVREPWWFTFEDPILNLLVGRALSDNNEVKRAMAQTDQARAEAGVALSALFPQVDATGSIGRGTLGQDFGDKVDTAKQAGVSGKWDIDVFGGNRRRTEAAQANLQAAIAHETEARNKLISDVIKHYVRLRAVQQKHKLMLKNIDSQKESVSIAKQQYTAGLITKLDVLRARSQLQSTQSRLPHIKVEQDRVLNRLAVLLADKSQNIEPLVFEVQPVPIVKPDIVSTTPIEVIRRRPDVQMAERQLAQATALSGAAFANFFPKISLEGFFGSASSDSFGATTPWNTVLSGLLPILNFGRIQSQVDAADAQEKQAYYNFRQTVLLAVEDTENAFTGYLQEVDRQVSLKQVATDQSEAAGIARQLYLNGTAPQLDLLTAEQNALEAQLVAVESQAKVSENLVDLYVALGSPVPDETMLSEVSDIQSMEESNQAIEDLPVEKSVSVAKTKTPPVAASKVTPPEPVGELAIQEPSVLDIEEADAPIAYDPNDPNTWN